MKVLIATDGSKFSKAAIAKSCQVLQSTKDLQFKIVSVVTSYNSVYPALFDLSAAYRQTLETLGCQIAECYIAAAEKTLRECFPNSELQTSGCIHFGSSPARLILKEAERWNADLIVVGSHGRNLWQRALLGSVSQSVTQYATRSVLIVQSAKRAKRAKLLSAT